MPYWQRAAAIFSRFRVDIPAERVDTLMQQAYGEQWDDPRIAPVVEVVAGMHVLELWHGPTSAFKDMALQCMPLFFSEAVERKQERGELDDDFLVLVATSGDTGKAALEGFADRAHTNIVVFYPADGVSDIQRKQMVTQHGDNVGVFGVRGNFDDCQTAVKAAFADEAFTAELHEKHRLRLSSANSINWGRLMPQIVYYVSAYADMVASGGVKPGEVDGRLRPHRQLRQHPRRLLRARDGRAHRPADLREQREQRARRLHRDRRLRHQRARVRDHPQPHRWTSCISSNLERLLYHLAGPEAVRGWMAELAEKKRFQVDPETFRAVRELLIGDFVTNDESLATVKRIWDETGYLMDPHTAVAWEVAERTQGDAPVLVVSTAHWAKFGGDVLKALRGVACADPLPAEYAGLTGVELLARVQEIATEGACVPKALAELDSAPVRFGDVVDAGREGVESAVREWLG